MSSPTSRRKFLTTVGAAGTIAVAGCSGGGSSGGGGGEQNQNSGDDGGSGGGSGDSSGSSGGGSGDVTITFWHAMGGAHGEAVDSLVGRFNEMDNGIKIEAEFQGGYREAFNAALSAAEAGNAPDILQVNEVASGGVLGSGAFEPVEKNLPDAFDRSNYHQFMMDYYTMDGSLQATPFNVAGGVLYYNKDALSEVGADAPSKDARFSEVRDISQQIVDGGFSNHGITWPNASYFVENWFALQDQVLVNNRNGRESDPTEIFLESDASVNAFDWWASMAEDGLYETQGIEAWGSATQSFINGNAGMMISSTSALGALKSDAEFEIGTAYMPMPDDVTRTGLTVGGGALWTRKGLSGESELSSAAGEFLHWLLQPEQGAEWNRETGYQPPHVGARDVLEGNDFFQSNPAFETIYNQFSDTESTIATRGAVMKPFLQVRTMISEGYTAIAQGTPVEQGLSQTKQEIDRLLERNARGN